MPNYRVLFFGDSLTAGYGLRDASSEAFPALIQKKIDAERWPYEVVNAGLSGDTSAGGLSRLDYWLAGRVDVFILELGINDLMRGVPPQTTLQNLEAIVERVKSKHPQATLALMGMEIPQIFSVPVADEFRSLFRKLATKHKMVFVPFFLEGVAGQAHLNLMDGLHPSAKGYQVIADNVWPTLKPLLDPIGLQIKG
jgi:acyl-CoA thioesterase-1